MPRHVSGCTVTLLCFFLLCLIHDAGACRFNVRDVGFVNFDPEPYTLYAFHKATTPVEDVEAFHQIAFAALLDTNIELKMVDLAETTDEDVLRFFDEGEVATWPHPVLVSPSERSTVIEWAEGETNREAIWNTIERITETPSSIEILDRSIETYGLVLIIEGPDDALNQQALAATNASLQTVFDNMENLPKEIKRPPVSVTIPYERVAEERLLLWAMGIPADINTTHAAILYGRGRQIGEVFVGEEISQKNLESILHVIGLSCECGLDRSWMMGTMIPLRWDKDRQQMAANELGFDTESPLVKSEITQIMSLGKKVQEAARGGGEVTIDSLLIGYSEVQVGESDSPPSTPEDLTPVPVMEEDIAEEEQAIAMVEPDPQAMAGKQGDMWENRSIRWNWMVILVMGGLGGFILLIILGTTYIILSRGRNA